MQAGLAAPLTSWWHHEMKTVVVHRVQGILLLLAVGNLGLETRGSWGLALANLQLPRGSSSPALQPPLFLPSGRPPVPPPSASDAGGFISRQAALPPSPSRKKAPLLGSADPTALRRPPPPENTVPAVPWDGVCTGTGMGAAPNAASWIRIMPGDVGAGCRECTAMDSSVLLGGTDRWMEALQLNLAPHGWLRPANHHWET